MPATTTDLALDHYKDRQSFVDATAEAAGQMWSDVDPNKIADSWAVQIPELTGVVAGGQLGAARLSDDYTTGVLESEDVSAAADAAVNPRSFAGVASDGRGLASLLTNPVFVALTSIQDGLDVAHALAAGRANLDMLVRTQVADAGRAADQVAITTRRSARGYTRVAVGNTCARCLVLAGKFYQWNTGFQRHPRCDCIHVPSAGAKLAGISQDPERIYRSMSSAERTRAGFTKADQRALADGADLSQVVNAHRGMYVAGGHQFTTEGTTRRGFARSRLGRGTPRITPDEIYRAAGDDRAEALRLLHRNGYLIEEPAAASRAAAARVEVGSGAGGSRVVAAPSTVVTIRPELARTQTVAEVSRAFEAEALRITGRDIRADLRGSVLTAEEHAEGVLRVLERYPDTNLRVIGTAALDTSSYAETANGIVLFNSHWSSAAGRQRYLKSLSESVETRFHPIGMDNPAGIAIHEMGHVLEIETLGEVVRPEIEQILADALRQAKTVDLPRLIGYDVSRYAAEGGIEELAAEAFTDVMMNGAAASRMSRAIYDTIKAEYEAGGRAFVTTPRVASRAGVDPLAGKTVAQLRALATERGVRLPARALKPDILAALRDVPGASEPAATVAARARQAIIDAKRDAADALAEVASLLDNGASARALASRGEGIAARVTGQSARDLGPLIRALKNGDAETIQKAMAALQRKAGLRPVGGAVSEIRSFDRAVHQSIGGPIGNGSLIRVIRPGFEATVNGETVRLMSAAVQKLDAADAAAHARALQRAAARERNRQIEQATGSARLLAEVDELLGKKADVEVIRQRLDPALIARDQVFANADPAVLAALRKAADTGPAALRAAVTRQSTKAGIKPITKAGAKLKFDPDLMESIAGIEIKAGTQVTVVRRGASVTLPDGTVLQLEKARVATVVPKVSARPSIGHPSIREFMDEAPTYQDFYAMDTIQERYDRIAEHGKRFAEAIDGQYAGLGVKVSATNAFSRDFILIEGKITDPATGKTVGKFTRSFTRNAETGEITANHALLTLQRNYRGSGFAEEFNQNLFDWYRRSGIKTVEVHANIDVGAYAWATKGFDFASPASAQRLISKAETKIAQALAKPRPPKGVSRAELEELQAYMRSIQRGEVTARAFDISQFGRQPGQGGKDALWPGKWLLLGKDMDWQGVLSLR